MNSISVIINNFRNLFNFYFNSLSYYFVRTFFNFNVLIGKSERKIKNIFYEKFKSLSIKKMLNSVF